MLFDNLSPNQEEAVKTIDDDIEIIACVGAGKPVLSHGERNIF